MVDRKEVAKKGLEQQQIMLFCPSSFVSWCTIRCVSKNCKMVLQTLDSKFHTVTPVEPGYRPTSIYHACVNYAKLISVKTMA